MLVNVRVHSANSLSEKIFNVFCTFTIIQNYSSNHVDITVDKDRSIKYFFQVQLKPLNGITDTVIIQFLASN